MESGFEASEPKSWATANSESWWKMEEGNKKIFLRGRCWYNMKLVLL
jgi:hypothetical protein